MTITTSGTALTFSDATTQTTGAYFFPAGTAMLFQQTAAPTGWTKSTTYNDYAIRIVNGTASTGGSSSFSTCFANQTPTINVSGLSAGATTLSTPQMPSHSHNLNYKTAGATQCFVNATNFACTALGCLAYTSNTNSGNKAGYVVSTGGGGSHTHSISGSASSSAVTLAVQYVDHIIATKN